MTWNIEFIKKRQKEEESIIYNSIPIEKRYMSF